MALEFNPDGSIKLPKKGSKKFVISEKIQEKETIAVVKANQDQTHPVIKIKCPKCKNNKAYFWTLQTRAADEDETKFYKCKKCEHTWRVYK